MAKKKTKPTAKKHTTTKKVLKKQIDEYKDIRMIPRHIAIYLLVVGVLLCLSLILGVSYSIYQVDNTQSESNQITVGCFTINFEDSGTSNTYTNLSITNSYPISTQTALAKTPYTFKVTNTCDYVAKADIAINVLKTSSVTNLATQQGKTIGDMLVTAIKEGNNAISTPVQLSSLTEGTIRTGDTETDVSYILRTEYLEKNQPKTYSLWIWVPEEINGVEVGNEAQGLTLYSKVDVYSEAISGPETVTDSTIAHIKDGQASQLRNLSIRGGEESNTKVGQDGTIDIVVSGKNLLMWEFPSRTDRGITWTNNNDGSYTATGTITVLSPTNFIDNTLNVPSKGIYPGHKYCQWNIVTTNTGNTVKIPTYKYLDNNYYTTFGIERFFNDGTKGYSSWIVEIDNNVKTAKFYLQFHQNAGNEVGFVANNVSRPMLEICDDVNTINDYFNSDSSFERYKEMRYTIELKDTNGNTINGLGSDDTLKKVNGVWVIDSGSTQVTLANATQDALNNISIYDGISNIWVDDDVLISNISATYLS